MFIRTIVHKNTGQWLIATECRALIGQSRLSIIFPVMLMAGWHKVTCCTFKGSWVTRRGSFIAFKEDVVEIT